MSFLCVSGGPGEDKSGADASQQPAVRSCPAEGGPGPAAGAVAGS